MHRFGISRKITIAASTVVLIGVFSAGALAGEFGYNRVQDDHFTQCYPMVELEQQIVPNNGVPTNAVRARGFIGGCSLSTGVVYVALQFRATTSTPWEQISEALPVGTSTITGRWGANGTCNTAGPNLDCATRYFVLNRTYAVQNGSGNNAQSNGCGGTGEWRAQIQYQPAKNLTGLIKTVSTAPQSIPC